MDLEKKCKQLENKYYKLHQKFREEVIKNDEREKSNRDTRYDLMLQLRDMTEQRDALQENFDMLVKHVDKLKSGVEV